MNMEKKKQGDYEMWKFFVLSLKTLSFRVPYQKQQNNPFRICPTQDIFLTKPA